MIGLYYNSEIRNNGTAVLCYDALSDTRGHGWGHGLEKNVSRYNRPGMEDTEGKHELHIMIDDGRDDIEWTPPKPNAFWAIDTHLGYDRRLSWARDFDYVFTAQKEGAAQMRKDGIENAIWMPLACHPPAHPNYAEMMDHSERDFHCADRGLEKQHDTAFVGFMQDETREGFHNRTDYLDTMFKAFPDSWLSINCFFETMAVRYIRARVGLNISIKNDLNMRFFEVMSTGTFLMSNADQEGYEDLGFFSDIHFGAYSDVEDCIKRTRYFLDNHEEREEIAKKGHELVRRNHTYKDRMHYMLEVCDAHDTLAYIEDQKAVVS